MPAPTPSTYRVGSRVRRRLFPQSNGTSLSESAPASNSPLRGSSTTSVQMMNRSRPPTRRVLFRPRSGAIVRPSNSALSGSPLVHASIRQPPPFVIADDHDFSYDRTHHDRGAHASWYRTDGYFPEILQCAEAPHGIHSASEAPSSVDVHEEIDHEAASQQAEVERRRLNTVRRRRPPATAEIPPRRWRGRLSFLNRPNLVSRLYEIIFTYVWACLFPQPVHVPRVSTVPSRFLRPHARPACLLTSFLSNNVTTLRPGHPSYPPPGSDCSICLEPFDTKHPPALVVNILNCRGHVFGHECLRKNIASGLGNSNKCPLCRTRWFRKYVSGPPRRRGEEFERGEVRAAAWETGTLYSLAEFFSKDFNWIFLLCVVCMVIQVSLCLMFPMVDRASRQFSGSCSGYGI
jgi:hypothetical protein